MDADFLQTQIRSVGLTPDARGARIFGVEAHRMKRTASNGVLQDPHQLSSALMHFTRSPLRVHTYLEVGVWSAWTNALISAVLARLARGRHEFRGYACDRWDKYVSGDTRKVLKALNVSFILRGEADYAALVADDATRIDLCFIDADHNYYGVRRDYHELNSKCRRMMFHDTVDFDTLTREGGGVPIFWSELVRSVNRSRVYEFLDQPATYPPVLGIGVLEPNALTGDGRIDTPTWQPAFMGAGRRPQALGFWEWLCTLPAIYKGPPLSLRNNWTSSLVTHCKSVVNPGARNASAEGEESR